MPHNNPHNNTNDISIEDYKDLIAHDLPKPHWTSHLKGGQRQQGEMNRLEASYASYLDMMVQAGVYKLWMFEAVKLRLAKKTTYTADFLVQAANDQLELHEVKGAPWADDARVKIKVAAALYPFWFIGITHSGRDPLTGWKQEHFSV